MFIVISYHGRRKSSSNDSGRNADVLFTVTEKLEKHCSFFSVLAERCAAKRVRISAVLYI